MKILDFIKQLLPHTDKNKVLEDLRVTIAELENIVLPSYMSATDHFKVNKLKSDYSSAKSLLFYRNIDLHGSSKQANLIADIKLRLVFIKDNTEYVLGLVESLMERDIINEGLTAKKAILLRAAGTLSFLSRYSLELLNVLYVQEALHAGAASDLQLSPASLQYIEHNFVKFVSLLSDYGIPNKAFSKMMLGLPDVIVSSRTGGVLAGIYKEQDIDPMAKAYMSGFTGSPIYHTRLLVAEWQANRYKANKDKKKMLELRLLHLNILKEGQSDARLEQEIEYIQNRVDKISRYLTEVETSLEG